MPVDKKPKQKATPKDFFLHLLSIITLYVSAVSLGTVLFQIINLQIPDPLRQGQFYAGEIAAQQILRQGISSLVIFFPAYLGTVFYLNNLYKKDKTKKDLRIRKWLIYFTLFAATVIILFSLSSLIKHFLDGELTLRFILKLLSILFISFSVLGYYGWDIKKDSQTNI